jgi:hypothetical protein
MNSEHRHGQTNTWIILLDDNTAHHIINEQDQKPWKPVSKSVNSRKVQHYGLSKNTVEETEQIPDFL